jgi:hypothetical protein
MDERHAMPGRAGSRLIIDELITGGAAALQRVFEIRDAEAQMVDAGPFARQEFADRAFAV